MGISLAYYHGNLALQHSKILLGQFYGFCPSLVRFEPLIPVARKKYSKYHFLILWSFQLEHQVNHPLAFYLSRLLSLLTLDSPSRIHILYLPSAVGTKEDYFYSMSFGILTLVNSVSYEQLINLSLANYHSFILWPLCVDIVYLMVTFHSIPLPTHTMSLWLCDMSLYFTFSFDDPCSKKIYCLIMNNYT